MSNTEIRRRFRELNVWRRGGIRAPHKPLLLLFALGRLSQGQWGKIPFAEVDPALQALLLEFGPPRKAYHSEYPFWRLQNDGVWELDHTAKLKLRKGQTDAKKSELLKYAVRGGFTTDIETAFREDLDLVREVAQDALEANFPDSMHEDIVAAVRLELNSSGTRSMRKRDAAFRPSVLRAYEFQCAVCGLALSLGDHAIALEAAHVKWRQSGGPDSIDNGLSLCCLHHKTFDRGAFTVDLEYVIQVSEHARRSIGFHEWLMRFHGASIKAPLNKSYKLRPEYLKWHSREVFRHPPRIAE